RQLLKDEGVTVLNQTPSAFRQLIQADIDAGKVATGDSAPPLSPPSDGVNESLSSLRYVIFGGEKLELSSLKPWVDMYGDERPQHRRNDPTTPRPDYIARAAAPGSCRTAIWSISGGSTIR